MKKFFPLLCLLLAACSTAQVLTDNKTVSPTPERIEKTTNPGRGTPKTLGTWNLRFWPRIGDVSIGILNLDVCRKNRFSVRSTRTYDSST
ncbi:MAG: hypothetical protein IPJ30_17260 [Acidobacteria bacterium]|nr:hypothetical protein [Acidobacteriota bacterium]